MFKHSTFGEDDMLFLEEEEEHSWPLSQDDKHVDDTTPDQAEDADPLSGSAASVVSTATAAGGAAFPFAPQPLSLLHPHSSAGRPFAGAQQHLLYGQSVPGGRAVAPASVASSSGAAPAAPAMGSSVPIAIPAFTRWPPAATQATEAAPAPAPASPGGRAFVPPHCLVAASDARDAAEAALKRERLRQRNAVLRVTGFLEAR